MLVTTERPKPWRIAGRAWRGLISALLRMTPLFVIAYVLMAGLDIAIDRVPAMLSIPSREAFRATLTAGRSLHAAELWKAIGLDVASAVLRALIIAPAAVAVHRFILLEGRARFAPLVSLRFAAWILALQAPALVLWWLILFASQATGLAPVLSLLLIAYVVVLIQASPLFAAVAVGEPSITVSARLETALERTEHLWLRTAGTLILTLLPVILARAVAQKAFAKLAEHLPLLAPLAKAAAGLVSVTLVAAAVSWLYSYAAHRKDVPDAKQGAPSPV